MYYPNITEERLELEERIEAIAWKIRYDRSLEPEERMDLEDELTRLRQSSLCASK